MLRMVVLFKGLRLTELGDVTRPHGPNSGGMVIGSAGLIVSAADPFPNGLRHGKFMSSCMQAEFRQQGLELQGPRVHPTFYRIGNAFAHF